jgi:2-hydroxychromene-2-carboxylate isomerase
MTTPNRQPSERILQAEESVLRSLDQKEQDIIDGEHVLETLRLMGEDTTELEQGMRDAVIEYERARAALASQVFRGRQQAE